MDNNREIIDIIKDKVDIVDYIGKHVKLKKAGRNYSALCPFHNEKTPSFMINPLLRIFKCFGCGKSGDIFTFVSEFEHLDFVDTLEKLAKIAGVQLPPKRSESKFQQYFLINEIAKRFYKEQLKNSSIAHSYISTTRGVNSEMMDKFEIGYAPGNKSLYKFINNKRPGLISNKEFIINCGLFVEKNKELFDKFNNRITFPIKNISGRVVGFQCRSLPNNEYGPKYLNSPETPIYSKKDSIYGLYESKVFIREKDICIISEGTMDVISGHSVEINNIVAPLGTGLTQEQLKIIKNYTNNVLFLFDNDKAGQKALERAFKLSSPLNLNCYASNTGQYKGLDDVIHAEIKNLPLIFESKVDAFSYLLLQFIGDKDLSKYSDYTKVVKYLRFLLEDVHDVSLRNFYINKIEKITLIKPEEIGFGVSKDFSKEILSGSTLNRAKKFESDPEVFFLALILIFKNYEFLSKYDLKYFINTNILKILTFIKSSEGIDEESIIKKFKEDQKIYPLLQYIYLELSEEFTDLPVEKVLTETYERIKNNSISSIIKKLRIKLATLEESGDDSTINKITSEINRLSKLKMHEQ